VRTIGMTVEQAEAILAAARQHEADSFLASQEQGSGLIEASLLAEEDGILEVITVDERGAVVARGDD
jgi:phage terminase large subunit-like protein